MHGFEIIIALLLAVSLLSIVSEKLKVPYPIFLVVAGLAIGFIPGMPKLQLDPALIFLLFLPPLLYVSALNTSWRDFKSNIRNISLLAIGLVLFSTVSVALFVKYFIPGMDWASAFLLGAIVSPPDAIAATAICKRLGVPKRIITILEGESLINDATGLIAYKFALAAVLGASFSFMEASGRFIYAGFGGVVLGIALGYLIGYFRSKIDKNPTIATIMSLLTPFAAYIPAEAVGVSGIICVVTIGIFLTRRTTKILGAITRLQVSAVWQTLVFLMNGIIFIIIGLQLPIIVSSLSDYGLSQLLGYAAATSAVVVISRIVWVIPAAYIPFIISRSKRTRSPMPKIRNVLFVAWAGMRGIVSLAAAMAIPFVIDSGEKLPHRDLIIFLTFSVIFSTLVIQGLSLPFVIKLLKITPDDKEVIEEIDGRSLSAKAVLDHIEKLIKDNAEYSKSNKIQSLKNQYSEKHLYYSFLKENQEQNECLLTHQQELKFHLGLLKVEREHLVKLRDKDIINDETLRKILTDIDLEEAALISK